ncbi:hemolysin III family protein [Ammoniphilus sp. CFH 90114]|uniref:PAQR family membrane homeostasis protein TrhA n=1 Tax=Ammoniphilus sp. CFH 90114 TaxID=2493665 RepID=UPI00100FA0D6|nr:hemolysin III family protein [Ammoniphilus sp. CFH 90114]RXT15325.1 hemolysin D [Ammoniphilus sp. CFH 90114]
MGSHTYSRREEIANAITHGVGVLFSIAALVLLIVYSAKEGTTAHVVSFSIYGASMLLLYLSSTLLHSLQEGKAKDILEIMDHASIYVFIAGSYTPILLVVVKGTLGITLLSVVWSIALFGIIFKVFFTKRFLFLSTVIYLMMGWMIVFAFEPVVASLATNGLIMLVAGGLLYTLGTIFYMWRLFPYHHAVWHLFVVGGSVFHFFTIFFYVLPIH